MVGVTTHSYSYRGTSFHRAMCSVARNRSPLTRKNALSGGTSNTMIQPQRNRRNQGAFRHLQLPGHGDARNRNGKTTGSLTASGAGIGTHDGSTCGVVSSDQNMGGTKSLVDFSADERDNSSRRSLAHRGNGAQDSESKVGVS